MSEKIPNPSSETQEIDLSPERREDEPKIEYQKPTSIEIGPKEEMEVQLEDIESLLQKIKKAVEQQDPSTYNNDDVWDAIDEAMQKLSHAEMLIVEQDLEK